MIHIYIYIYTWCISHLYGVAILSDRIMPYDIIIRLIHICIYTYTCISLSLYICMYVYIHIHMYVCIYVYSCMCVHSMYIIDTPSHQRYCASLPIRW